MNKIPLKICGRICFSILVLRERERERELSFDVSVSIPTFISNPLHPNIGMHILRTGLHTFPIILVRRIWKTI